jgi:hypothetical protein
MVMTWFCWSWKCSRRQKKAGAVEVVRDGGLEQAVVTGSGVLRNDDAIEPVQIVRTEHEGFYAPATRTRDNTMPAEGFYAPHARR